MFKLSYDMTHRKQGYRFKNDWPPEHQDYLFQNYKSAVTIPVNVEIEVDHHVLNMDNVKQILSGARIISLMDCGCRSIYGHCDAPVSVCIDINEFAELNIASSQKGTNETTMDEEHAGALLNAREITLDEAMEVLEKTHKAGLVHMAYGHGEFYEPGVINSICSCCTCCCGVLSGILRFGLAPHLLTSHSIAVTDESACIACGQCVERCQFGAKEKIDGSLTVNNDLCFGCGLCLSTCPTNAITLIDK